MLTSFFQFAAPDPPSALPLVRAVIRECHRFIRAHPDPSVVYTRRSAPKSPSPSKTRSRTRSRSPFASSRSHQSRRTQSRHRTDIDLDQPTAFHSLLGTSLLYIGTLFSLDPGLALPDEPREPATYWLAAVDVFEMGESVVGMAQGESSEGWGCAQVEGDSYAGDDHRGGRYGCHSLELGGKREDWRMAMAWGHTLVALAEEKVRWAEKEEQDRRTRIETASRRGKEGLGQPSMAHFTPQAYASPSFAPCSPPPYSQPSHTLSPYTLSPLASASHSGFSTASSSNGNPFTAPAPQWPSTSPFHAIAATGAGATTTQRAGLARASAHEVLVLAMDQFSRAMLHMPRAGSASSAEASVHNGGVGLEGPDGHHRQTSSHLAGGSFSRARELHGIALALLDISERLPVATEREYWAGQAELVLAQMRMDVGVREVAGLAKGPSIGDVGGARPSSRDGGEDEVDWRQGVDAARGRCWLVVGSARAEELEAGLEAGDLEVLRCRSAEEAREGLAMGEWFFVEGLLRCVADDVFFFTLQRSCSLNALKAL
jgi:hypothetical protein